MKFLFVYGSLMSGMPNDIERLGLGQRMCNATTVGQMFSSKTWFPCTKFSEEGIIHGEIYVVHDDAFIELDRIEGSPYLFVQKDINVTLANGQALSAVSYEFVQSTEGLVNIPYGDWRLFSLLQQQGETE